MSKKQARRSVSVRGTTYALIAPECAARSVSLSEYVEELVAADRKARGLTAPLPSVSVIKVGPPASQLKLPRSMPPLDPVMGARPYLPRPVRQPTASPAWDASHMLPKHQAAAKKAQASKVPPISAGSTGPRFVLAPHSGNRVPPPDAARGPRNVMDF